MPKAEKTSIPAWKLRSKSDPIYPPTFKKRPSRRPENMRTTTFQPQGHTVHFVVGPEDNQHELIVCPQTVSRSSPVFNKMLFGPFQESEANSNVDGKGWIVALPKDHADALVVIMNIVHSRFDEVPMVLEMDLLYHVTTTCHKYDMSSILRPWALEWCEQHRRNTTPDPRLLWIALELGHAKFFDFQLGLISRCVWVDRSSDQLKGPHGRVFEIDDHIVSMDVTDALRKNYTDGREAIKLAWGSQFTQADWGSSIEFSTCPTCDRHDTRAATTCGTIMKVYMAEGIVTFSPDRWFRQAIPRVSLGALFAIADRITRTCHAVFYRTRANPSGCSCGRILNPVDLDALAKKYRLRPTEKQVEYLRAQSKKTGCPGPAPAADALDNEY